MTADLGRRRVIAGTAGLGLATPLLAACGGDDGGSDSADGGSGGGGGPVATTADVPVGGGTINSDEEVVVTQPAEGEFKAFTAVCTHQGCIVGKVENNEIMCPCHGSAFSAEDGSVVTGPATEPLAAVQVSVEGDQISLA
ncbi:Rieske (2Fe-2S) protein [Nocardioides sp. GXQ0305]|uniref:Rieske (2Fe-2S) protein n=1 Tax=Nocardioides sp. GXQ0305 TaxID=3423912 RepID=UPI003D7E166E